MTLTVQVGKLYKNREGIKVRIIEQISNPPHFAYPFLGDDSNFYSEWGIALYTTNRSLEGNPSDLALVEEIPQSVDFITK